MLDVAGPPQQLHKVLVVGDDQQLEVTLARATLNDSGEGEQEETNKYIQFISNTCRCTPCMWLVAMC